MTFRCDLPVSSGTRQHLVDTQYMEGVDSDTNVKLVLPTVLYHVLVGTDAPRLQSLTGQLLMLIRHQMNTQREIVHWRFLGPQIIDSDL